MSDFGKSEVVHDSSVPLKSFLETRLQPWRWAIMLGSGGIRVQRAGKPIDNLTLDTTLAEGDVVVIDDAYSLTWMELRRWASTDYRDLVFCPQRNVDEKDTFLKNQVKALLEDSTALDVRLDIENLKELVAHLTPLGTNPIRHITLVSHANPFGDILIPVRRPRNDKDTVGDVLNWESLKEAIGDGSLRIGGKDRNPTLLPRPETSRGEQVPCAIIVRGCSSGVHTNLLQKIQEAFGSMIDTVVMPKYFDGADFINKTAASVEYFMHRFKVTSKTRLDRHGVIEAFKAAKLTDWLKNPVPDGDWYSLVGHDMTIDKVFPTKPLTMRIDGRSQPAVFKARFDTTPLEPTTLYMDQASKPTTAEIKKFLINSWTALPMFHDDEWPYWERLGLATMDEFEDYWTYELNPHIKGVPGKWPVRGIRYAWEIRTPLVDGGTMICHYRPINEPGAESNNIDYNDDRIFGRYRHIPPHYAQTL